MRLDYRIREWFRTLKRKIRSIPYGFDIIDTWAIDYALAKWLHPRLELFIQNTIGHPCDMEYEEWISYLSEMSNKIEFYLDAQENVYSIEHDRKAYAEYKEAMQMFTDRIYDMWD